jgi:hypothetical protein
MADSSLDSARLASLAEEWRDVAQRAVDTVAFAVQGIGGYDRPNTRFWRITPKLAEAVGEIDGETLEDLCNELLRPNDPPRPDYRQNIETLWKRCRPILDAIEARETIPAVSQEKPKRVIFDQENGILVVDGRNISLGPSEKFVLGILVPKKAASFGELQNACDRPDRTLKALLKKHPCLDGAIMLPGGGYKGGYSTTIKLKRQSARSRQK